MQATSFDKCAFHSFRELSMSLDSVAPSNKLAALRKLQTEKMQLQIEDQKLKRQNQNLKILSELCQSLLASIGSQEIDEDPDPSEL